MDPIKRVQKIEEVLRIARSNEEAHMAFAKIETCACDLLHDALDIMFGKTKAYSIYERSEKGGDDETGNIEFENSGNGKIVDKNRNEKLEADDCPGCKRCEGCPEGHAESCGGRIA